MKKQKLDEIKELSDKLFKMFDEISKKYDIIIERLEEIKTETEIIPSENEVSYEKLIEKAKNFRIKQELYEQMVMSADEKTGDDILELSDLQGSL